ncbi:hypothetical protein [Acetobacter sicerae]|uniref:hypothetical protein n=1 Tax=Acetobacter sicerae TaxID=85325 RepID=UPI00156AE55C|nr:hypothetical protein [Acetobacter sicerae]NHN93147.1 hypothetical protein [Acetobacter sicerae]
MTSKASDESASPGQAPWGAWEWIKTDFGPARVRSRLKAIYAETEFREFELRHGNETWIGQNTSNVNGHQSFRVGSVFAVDSPHLAFVGDEHASSLDAFVRFAVPYLVSGSTLPDLIGKPRLYFND